MTRGDRFEVLWEPDNPIKSFHLNLVTRGEQAPPRYYAVTVRAVDAHGEEVIPTDKTWGYSDSLNAFFKYSVSPGGPGGGTSIRWESDVYPSKIAIAAVQWANETVDNAIDAIAVAPDGCDPGRKVWKLLSTTMEG